MSAVANAKELEEAGIAKLLPQTVRNFLLSTQFRAYTPRNKPQLSQRNTAKRLLYSKEYIHRKNEISNAKKYKTKMFTKNTSGM